MDSVGALLPFVLILLAFYVLIIRPARKRKGLQTRLQDSLAVGQKIMTTSGMYAEIAAVDDDAVVLETSPGVTQRWAKPAVARVLDETAPDAEDDAERDSEAGTEHETGVARAQTGTAGAPAESDTQTSDTQRSDTQTDAADSDSTGKRPE